MIPYASNTGTRRNLDQLRKFGWRILLTPANPKPRENLRHGVDNGAWTAYQQKTAFDSAAFAQLVERVGSTADFVIAPDIVAGGLESLAFSLEWLPRLRNMRQVLLPLQDGMEPAEIGKVLKAWPSLGLALGGTTEWKLETMYGWGMVAAAFDRWYHILRVNSSRRIRLCAEAGATSFDGTSATMFSCTVPKLDNARNQGSLLCPATGCYIA